MPDFRNPDLLREVNGYPVLAQGPSRTGDCRVVLCFRTDYTFDQFVTWNVFTYPEGQLDVSHGRYFNRLSSAVASFDERSFGEVY